MGAKIEAPERSKNKGQIPAGIARTARAKGREIESLVCGWTRRWGVVTDASLQAIYQARPRLGYDLWRRGLLERHEAPLGVRVHQKHAYTLTDEGHMACEAFSSLPEKAYAAPEVTSVAWASLEHLLGLQRAAASHQLSPSDPDWWSEPELRALFPDWEHIPDLMILEDPDAGLVRWIEYERSRKAGIKLDWWMNGLHNFQTLALSQRNNQSKWYEPDKWERQYQISTLVILVDTTRAVQNYEQAFKREALEQVYRHKGSRQLRYNHEAPRLPTGQTLKPIVQVDTMGMYCM